MRLIHTSMLALAVALAGAAPARAADPGPDGLLFRASGDKGLAADFAVGEAQPNFASDVDIVPDGAIGPAMRWASSSSIRCGGSSCSGCRAICTPAITSI